MESASERARFSVADMYALFLRGVGRGSVISAIDYAKLTALIAGGKETDFYRWRKWRHKREEILKLDNYECQMCKAEGRYRRGEIIHHVHHLTDRPDLALSTYDEDGKRQLITVCKKHHEAEHPESLHTFKADRFTTVERWD